MEYSPCKRLLLDLVQFLETLLGQQPLEPIRRGSEVARDAGGLEQSLLLLLLLDARHLSSISLSLCSSPLLIFTPALGVGTTQQRSRKRASLYCSLRQNPAFSPSRQ